MIWAERFTPPLAEIMHMRSTLAGEIVGALEPRIQMSEALQAARIPTEQLDAWAAYHRGLWHMYRFNRHDNALAAQLFDAGDQGSTRKFRARPRRAVVHAFPECVPGLLPDNEGEKRLARAKAAKSMELDPLDPFVNLTMGRAEWLSGHLGGEPAVDGAQHRAQPQLRLRHLQQRAGRHAAGGRPKQRKAGCAEPSP